MLSTKASLRRPPGGVKLLPGCARPRFVGYLDKSFGERLTGCSGQSEPWRNAALGRNCSLHGIASHHLATALCLVAALDAGSKGKPPRCCGGVVWDVESRLRAAAMSSLSGHDSTFKRFIVPWEPNGRRRHQVEPDITTKESHLFGR
jgi:hypothetical protein